MLLDASAQPGQHRPAPGNITAVPIWSCHQPLTIFALPLTGRFCSWLSGHFSARQSCKKQTAMHFFFGCPTAISTPCMSGSCQRTRSTRNFSQVSHTLSESSGRCTNGQETGQGDRENMTNRMGRIATILTPMW